MVSPANYDTSNQSPFAIRKSLTTLCSEYWKGVILLRQSFDIMDVIYVAITIWEWVLLHINSYGQSWSGTF
jgi:hypothetical protein